MDETTQAVRVFMESMFPVHEELMEIVRVLYKRAQIKLVTTYEPQPYLSCDLGVSAELKHGTVVDFWVEVSATGAGWIISPSVERHEPDEDGSHTEVDLRERSVSSAAALPTVLVDVLRELREAVGNDTLFR